MFSVFSLYGALLNLCCFVQLPGNWIFAACVLSTTLGFVAVPLAVNSTSRRRRVPKILALCLSRSLAVSISDGLSDCLSPSLRTPHSTPLHSTPLPPRDADNQGDAKSAKRVIVRSIDSTSKRSSVPSRLSCKLQRLCPEVAEVTSQQPDSRTQRIKSSANWQKLARSRVSKIKAGGIWGIPA